VTNRTLRIVVVTGLSGSGKTTAMHVFEDRGFFCVDNLPVLLIPDLAETITSSGAEVETIVLCIDARERSFLDDFDKVAEQIKAAGHTIEIFYMEARDEILIRRFSETRRRHPLAGVDIRAALEQERQILSRLRSEATHIIDTSVLSMHDLRQQIRLLIDASSNVRNLSLTLLSFGFKYGVPLETDVLFDVRCLPNPYFVPSLKHQTGLDDEAYDFIFGFGESRSMLLKIEDYLRFALPLFEKEGKTYLTLAIGCTGGRHRSVAFVRALVDYMHEELPNYLVFVRHRDVNK